MLTLLLALRLHLVFPALSVGAAYQHVAAADAAATARVPRSLVLAIAFVESHYDPTATSRVERGVRRTGALPATTPPRDLDARFELYCGVMQTVALTWPRCLAERDLDDGYAAGVAEMEQWLHDRRVAGNVALALAGHGCGNAGVATGSCNHYPERVLALARWIAHPAAWPSRAANA